MSLQLLSQINDNYLMAITAHREMADVCWFGYLAGYAMLHEYQLLDESMTQRKLKRYITSTYHTFAPDNLPKSANIAEPLIGGKNRKTMKTEESWKTVKEVFRIHQKWEESSLAKYQRIAAELLASGEVSTFNFVGEIIKDVKAELVYVTDKMIELNAHDWDMPQIISEQSDYVERFEYLIKNLLGDSMDGHHWNSLIDPQSRTSLLDKYPK